MKGSSRAARHRYVAGLCKKSYGSYTVKDHGIECLVIPVNELFYVAVRGTTRDFIDITRNARIFPLRTRVAGWVHAGYFFGAAAIVNQVISRVDKSRPIVLAGHSMGGAVAAVLACMLVDLGYHVEELVCFGSPKIGSLKRLEHTDCTLYKNAGDIVTEAVPFYRRSGPVTNIGTGKGFWGTHSIDNYCESLEGLTSARFAEEAQGYK